MLTFRITLNLRRACLSVEQLHLRKGSRAQSTGFSGHENADCQPTLCLEVLKWLPVPKCNMDGHLEHSTNAAGVPPSYIISGSWAVKGKATVSLNSVLSLIIQFFSHFAVVPDNLGM